MRAARNQAKANAPPPEPPTSPSSIPNPTPKPRPPPPRCPPRPSPIDETLRETIFSIARDLEATKALVRDLVAWQGVAMAQLGEYLGSPGFTPPPFPYVPPNPTHDASSFPPSTNDFEAGPSNVPKSGPSLLDILEAVDALNGDNEEEEEVKSVDEGNEVEHGVGEHDDAMKDSAWEEQEEDVVFVGEEDDDTPMEGVEGAIIESLGVEIEPLERVDANESLVGEPITPTTPISPLTPQGENFIISSRVNPLGAFDMAPPIRLHEVGGSGSVIKRRRLVKKSREEDDVIDLSLIDDDLVPSSSKPKKLPSKPVAKRTRSASSSLKKSFDFICGS